MEYCSGEMFAILHNYIQVNVDRHTVVKSERVLQAEVLTVNRNLKLNNKKKPLNNIANRLQTPF